MMLITSDVIVMHVRLTPYYIEYCHKNVLLNGVMNFVIFQDLLQIPSGTLAHLLQKVVSFAKVHVLSCWLCCQKGFICEVCNNPKVIYPFDMESTYRVSRGV
jgi:hypothetical protein